VKDEFVLLASRSCSRASTHAPSISSRVRGAPCSSNSTDLRWVRCRATPTCSPNGRRCACTPTTTSRSTGESRESARILARPGSQSDSGRRRCGNIRAAIENHLPAPRVAPDGGLAFTRPGRAEVPPGAPARSQGSRHRDTKVGGVGCVKRSIRADEPNHYKAGSTTRFNLDCRHFLHLKNRDNLPVTI